MEIAYNSNSLPHHTCMPVRDLMHAAGMKCAIAAARLPLHTATAASHAT